MELVINIAIFLVSMAVLVKASDYFVQSAEVIGVSLRIPHFVVGVIVVGFGTSLPELVSSVFAVIHGSSEIVIGNVLGSNITNILLVLGAAAVVGKEFPIEYNLMNIDLPILLGSSLMLALMIWDANFTIGEAVICFLCIGLYFLYSFLTPQQGDGDGQGKAGWKDWAMLLLSPVFVFLGAKYTIEAVVSVSETIGIGTEIIALSAVALGTSLPEVVVAVSSVRRGNPEMAIGNIIGSNIFNTYVVMGVSALFGSLSIPRGILEFSLPVSIFVTLIFVIMTVEHKLYRWKGWFLLIIYIFFIGRLYGWV